MILESLKEIWRSGGLDFAIPQKKPPERAPVALRLSGSGVSTFLRHAAARAEESCLLRECPPPAPRWSAAARRWMPRSARRFASPWPDRSRPLPPSPRRNRKRRCSRCFRFLRRPGTRPPRLRRRRSGRFAAEAPRAPGGRCCSRSAHRLPTRVGRGWEWPESGKPRHRPRSPLRQQPGWHASHLRRGPSSLSSRFRWLLPP